MPDPLLNPQSEPAPVVSRPQQTFTHRKAVTPPREAHGSQSADTSAIPRPPVTARSVYPEAVRRLPGSRDAAGMPIFAKLPALTAEAAQKRVYQRVQSLYVYACAVLVFGVVIVFGHQQVFGDALPIGLQIVSYTAAVLAVPCAAVLLASKRPDTVKRVLYVLWAGYTAAICTGFWMIIQNFVYFFGGIGLLIVIQMGFWLWTRSVLRDVNELSPTN